MLQCYNHETGHSRPTLRGQNLNLCCLWNTVPEAHMHTLTKTPKCHFPPLSGTISCVYVCCRWTQWDNSLWHFPFLETTPPSLLLTLTHTWTLLLFVIVRHIEWISGSLGAVPPPHCGIFNLNCLALVALGREKNLTRETEWGSFLVITITAKVHLHPNCSSGAVQWLAEQECAAL